MITNRYYTTTIIAIFLSLSLGILIGGTLGQQWIQQNQQKILSYYQREANQLRESNKEYLQKQKSLELELKEVKRESKELLHKSVVHMIDGKRILWIEDDSEDHFSILKDAIRIAGGTNDHLDYEKAVFQSLSFSETKQNVLPYDVIIYIPNEKEDLEFDRSMLPSMIPIVILSTNEKNKTERLTPMDKVHYQVLNVSSVEDHYDFIFFLKNLFEENKR
ncbi:copper transport outer membrane protein MctB [Tepidibacillus fermentans]|uniref:Copper transport outer membrane protein MctB n=1 Tax=Tepidibacillus fermentans TaxID=1281767 RepID=A0A4R3KJU2_9BACI|nr:copper transport outer membrane protein MctB [Tepidibacillus fermentans]